MADQLSPEQSYHHLLCPYLSGRERPVGHGWLVVLRPNAGDRECGNWRNTYCPFSTRTKTTLRLLVCAPWNHNDNEVAIEKRQAILPLEPDA